jgi:hypothetical protein
MSQVSIDEVAKLAYSFTKANRPDLLARLEEAGKKHDWNWGLVVVELDKLALTNTYDRREWDDLYLVFIRAEELASTPAKPMTGYAEL